MTRSIKRRWTLFGALIGTGTTLALVIGLGVFAGAGAASSSAKPVNTITPTITGTPQAGEKLTGHDGAWTGVTSYKYFFTRCSKSGNGCANISGATSLTYIVTSADVGSTLRFKVEATNADGSTTESSDQTAVVTAAGSPLPHNTSPPTISGTPQEGKTLSGDRGNWSGSPTDYNDYWVRCDKTGGSCSNISGANDRKAYLLKSIDVGNTIRFKVEAKNSGGGNFASSVPTAVITTATTPPQPTAAGCPSGNGAININSIGSPARLLIDQQQASPSVVNRGTNQLIIRYHVTACGGRSVQGALVYATAVPFNQLSIPAEASTNSTGWAELDMRMLAGFPVSSKQQLIAIFTRARKSGENLLAGISTRRLFSVSVNLRG